MEALMQYIWQYRLWPYHDMVTNDGHRIDVIDTGILNRDAGPDFFNAKIRIDNEEWVGNVEIHIRASDWYLHNHHTDKAYDSVILHVVDTDNTHVYRTNGDRIPQLVMKCDPNFAAKYNSLVNHPFRDLPCINHISSVPHIYISDWLNALGFERLYDKADRIISILNRHNGDWAQAIYLTLARALGFGTNSEPFELLAATTPLSHLLHYTDSLSSIEAILFGQAGLLDDADPASDPYVAYLIQEYKFLSTKFNLVKSPNILWKMARMRPQNFPHRRIATLARLIYNNRILSGRLLEVSDPRRARQLFDVEYHGYWTNHYNFKNATAHHTAKAFSTASIDVLLINVVVPLIFAYAQTTGNEKRTEFAVDLLQSIPPESNRIVEAFSRANIRPSDAFSSQAMIQLRRSYCEQRKCLFCRLGHRFLSSMAKRDS